MFKTILYFLKNVWRFRKELIEFRTFDEGFVLMMLRRSLEYLRNTLKYGNEIESSRFLKVSKMNRAIQIIEWHENDVVFIYMAEEKLAYDSDLNESNDLFSPLSNKRIYKLAKQYEEETWWELMNILRGQSFVNYENFDGSNLRTWWD